MNLDDFKKVAEYVMQLWGPSKRWDEDRLEIIAREFKHLDVKDAATAVRSLFNKGAGIAPSPSEVRKEMTEVIKLRIERGDKRSAVIVDCIKPTDHRWAIFDEYTNADGPRRLGKCVKCDAEKVFPADKLLTRAEISDRNLDQLRGDEAEVF